MRGISISIGIVRGARFTELDESLPSPARSAEDRTAARSEVAHVLLAVKRLPEMDRAALLMRANGLSYEEIAEAIGASVGAVKVRVHRARRRLSDAQHQGEHI